MTGDEFITLAEKLTTDARAGAAAYRTAASRAYYGAHHLAKALLKNELGCDPGASHGDTWNWLARTRNQRAKEASATLSTLYTHRRGADYDLDETRNETRRFAQLCVEMAVDIASTIRNCRDDENAMATMKAEIAKRKAKP